MRAAAWLLLACCAWSADLRLAPEERQAEAAWLASLGLRVPSGGPLVEQPFEPPFTKRSFLAPTAWWRAGSPQEIRADLLRQDLLLLRVIMEKAYGGWDSAAKRGWNWERWFAEWDDDLAGRQDAVLAPADALAPVAALMQFQLDNHSGPVGVPLRFGSGSRSAVLEARPGGTCIEMKTAAGRSFPLDPQDPAQRPKRARIVSPGAASDEEGYYFSYPAQRGAATAVECGGLWISARTWDSALREQAIAGLAQQDAGVPSYRRISPAIGYLRLPTFTKQNNERLRQLLPDLPAAAGHEKLLIVDMRQNGGGDNVLNEMARWLDDRSIRAATRFTRRQPKSCLYDALIWGYTQFTSQSLSPPLSAALLGSMQRLLDGLFTPAAAGCPVRIEEQRSQWDYRQHRFPTAALPGKPRLMVLVDSGCGSDCEYMAYMLAAEPGTVVVGESTYGVGQFIQPGYFILPHSRLKFRIALGMSDIYGDGRSFDGYGLNVDVVLAGDEAHSAPVILALAQAWAGTAR